MRTHYTWPRYQNENILTYDFLWLCHSAVGYRIQVQMATWTDSYHCQQWIVAQVRTKKWVFFLNSACRIYVGLTVIIRWIAIHKILEMMNRINIKDYAINILFFFNIIHSKSINSINSNLKRKNERVQCGMTSAKLSPVNGNVIDFSTLYKCGQLQVPIRVPFRIDGNALRTRFHLKCKRKTSAKLKITRDSADTIKRHEMDAPHACRLFLNDA